MKRRRKGQSENRSRAPPDKRSKGEGEDGRRNGRVAARREGESLGSGWRNDSRQSCPASTGASHRNARGS
eukprot:768386-Hanusia_phi.AAC.2